MYGPLKLDQLYIYSCLMKPYTYIVCGSCAYFSDRLAGITFCHPSRKFSNLNLNLRALREVSSKFANILYTTWLLFGTNWHYRCDIDTTLQKIKNISAQNTSSDWKQVTKKIIVNKKLFIKKPFCPSSR